MIMSREIVSYVTRMFYVLCGISITIKINKFVYFSYIDIIISVYGIMSINNDTIDRITIRLAYIWNFDGFIIINNIGCILVYMFRYVLVLPNVLLSDLLYRLFST